MSKPMISSANIEESTFNHIIAPYYQDIKKYCISLSATQWEAEDLFQDTLLKLYLALKKQPNREISKRFLYQIAKNAYLDMIRKVKRQNESFVYEDLLIDTPANDTYELQVREALEVLADFLSIKQFVIVLLMDVLQFTAKETAEMLQETEANIHTSLHRSRKKLQKCASYMREDPSSVDEYKHHAAGELMSDSLFETFINAFKAKDTSRIYSAYLSLVGQGVQVRKVATPGYTLCFQFTDPDGNVLMICSTP